LPGFTPANRGGAARRSNRKRITIMYEFGASQSLTSSTSDGENRLKVFEDSKETFFKKFL